MNVCTLHRLIKHTSTSCSFARLIFFIYMWRYLWTNSDDNIANGTIRKISVDPCIPSKGLMVTMLHSDCPLFSFIYSSHGIFFVNIITYNKVWCCFMDVCSYILNASSKQHPVAFWIVFSGVLLWRRPVAPGVDTGFNTHLAHHTSKPVLTNRVGFVLCISL